MVHFIATCFTTLPTIRVEKVTMINSAWNPHQGQVGNVCYSGCSQDVKQKQYYNQSRNLGFQKMH